MADLKGARKVTYESNDVEIPSDFLRGPSEKPVTMAPVPFATSAVPEYQKCFAVVLDNVLSPTECIQLIKLAEESSPPAEGDPHKNPWRPALVSVAPGIESPAPGYRESDRIIWDSQEITDRIWERCCQVEGLKEKLAIVRGAPNERVPGWWKVTRINKRMRFLRYSPGHYFKPHCDGPYYYIEGGKEFQTHYTVHLYLNNSKEVSPDSELEGGATGFLSWDEKRRTDVNPKAGSVLIFQHDTLLHEGAPVTKGQKFTVRTDILYGWEEKVSSEAA